MTYRLLLPCLLLFSGCGFINLVTEQEIKEVTEPFPGARKIEAKTFNGAITIRSDGKRKDAALKFIKRGRGVDQEAAKADLVLIECSSELKEDGTMVVEARRTSNDCKGGCELEIIVPEELLVQATTSNGKIHVTGPVKDSTLKTSNGSITLDRGVGKLDAHSSNGGITLSHCTGDALVKTSNGGITVDLDTGSLSAETSNGGIKFDGSLKEGDHKMHSSNGSIELKLKPNPNYFFETHASNGKVHNYLPTTSEGDGKVKVKLRTSNGSIWIKPMEKAT